jgi:hypothetical protein
MTLVLFSGAWGEMINEQNSRETVPLTGPRCGLLLPLQLYHQRIYFGKKFQNEDRWKILFAEDETSTEFYYLDENNQPITTSPR